MSSPNQFNVGVYKGGVYRGQAIAPASNTLRSWGDAVIVAERYRAYGRKNSPNSTYHAIEFKDGMIVRKED